MTENLLPPPIEDVQPHKQNHREKIVTYLVYALLALAGIALIVCFYWLATRQDAIQLNGPVTVNPDTVMVGGTVHVNTSYCKVTNAPGRVIQRFVSNTTEIFAPTITETDKKGCYNKNLPVVLPPTVTAGTWRVYYRIAYQTSPITTVTEDFYSEPFTVK